ncbi:hypothetical protein ACF1GW_39005 [Streptomyces achromogenes]|uniref:hypothetical protein n=1 Tax=Streptomyces achromogenes TaxID=67255 RepID=UPI0036F5BE4A
MTFARQLTTVRTGLALLAVIAAAAFATILAEQKWIELAVVLPPLAAIGWLAHLQWRMFSRQRDIADLAQQLREISRTVPAGTDRFYTSVLSTEAVHCQPDNASGFDQFSRLNADDIEGFNRVEAGDIASLPAVTYRVRRSFPIVWRHVWADRAVKGRDGEFISLPRQSTSYRDVFKLFLLNHRTGVLVPDRDDLTNLLHAIETADHVHDIPRKAK